MRMVFVPLVFPIFMLTVFSRVFSSLVAVPGFRGAGQYLEYLAPATVMMMAMLASGSAGLSTVTERQTGFHDRMRISPAGSGPSHLGRRLADGSRIFLFTGVITVVAWLSGVTIRNWFLAVLVTGSLAALWGVSYGGLTFSVCLRTGSAEAYQALVPWFFPVLFLSTAFVPLPLLPGWLHGVARVNPVSYICDAIRSAYGGALDSGAAVKALSGIAIVMIGTQLLIWRARVHIDRA